MNERELEIVSSDRSYRVNRPKPIEALPVPELIIPSVGGRMTSLAITQERVTGVTKIDPTMLVNRGEKGVIEDGGLRCYSGTL